ncbi:hypothetical protein EMCRGX_G033055 [Ephydatia muelleri]
MQYGHRAAPGHQHSGAPFSVAPTSTFYPSTFQSHPMIVQGSLGSHVFSGALHRQAEPIHCHPHNRGNSPINGGDMGGEDPLGVADVKPSCQYSLLQNSAHGEMPLDSSQLGNGQLPPLVTVGSQLQHHSIFAGSMYPSPDYHTPLGPSTPCLPQLTMWNYPPIPMQKLSYDSPKYKLTPERALPLVKWFEEHKLHPYPTRNEKILLCQNTQLTFTQVSTWFANARRRMKKSNVDDDKTSDDSATESPKGSSPPSKDHCTLPEY